MKHQQQPTKTSCGPTCVAMILGMSAKTIIRRLSKVRTEARARVHTERVNVGEMSRLLHLSGLTMGPRRRGALPHCALVRIDHFIGRGWHWTLKQGRWIYDPALSRAYREEPYLRSYAGRVSFYEVTDSAQTPAMAKKES